MPEGPDGTTAPPAPPPTDESTPAGDLGITVALDQFSGPMDLLLYLVRRAEVDIKDLPITTIADQFAAWVAAAAGTTLDLEAAGDFVVMAATLLEIKARQVAPPPEGTEVADDGEDEFDPRAGLIRKLLVYRAAKEAAFDLDRRDDERRLRHERGHREVVPDDPAEVDAWELKDVGVGTLANLWFDLLKRIDSLGPRTVIVDDVPMGVRIAQVVESMRTRGEGRMSELFALDNGLIARVGILMAILEGTRQRMLTVRQEEQYGDVHLRFRPEDERAIAGGDPGPPEQLPKRQRRPPLVTWQPRNGAAAEIDEDKGGDEAEVPVENEEQRFLRDLETEIGVERLLGRAADLERGFIAWWEETHPGEPLPPGVVKPEPPPPPPAPPVAAQPVATSDDPPKPKRAPPRPKPAAEAAKPAAEPPPIPDPVAGAPPVLPGGPQPAVPQPSFEIVPLGSVIPDPLPGAPVALPLPEAGAPLVVLVAQAPPASPESAPAPAAEAAAMDAPVVAPPSEPTSAPVASEPEPPPRPVAGEAGPVAASEPAVVRESIPPTEPVLEPVAAAEPTPEPVAAAEPAPEPVSVVEPEPEPVAAAEPVPEPVAAAEPAPEPVAVVEPALAAASPPAEPIAAPVSAPQPVAALPAVAAQPEAVATMPPEPAQVAPEPPPLPANGPEAEPPPAIAELPPAPPPDPDPDPDPAPSRSETANTPPAPAPQHPTPKPSTMSRPRHLKTAAMLALLVLAVGALVAWMDQPRDVLMASGPADGAIVSRTQPVAFTLNLPLDDASRSAAPLPVVNPPGAGICSWQDARTCVFTPAGELPADTAISVAFSEELRALGGFRFARDGVPSFTVRTLPAVALSSPSASLPAFGPGVIALQLNRVPINAAALLGEIAITPSLPLQTSISEGQVRLVGAFQPGVTYRLSVASNPAIAADDRPLAWQGEIAMPARTPGARLASGVGRSARIEAVGLASVIVENADGQRELVRFQVTDPNATISAELPAWLLKAGENRLRLRWADGAADIVLHRHDLPLTPDDAAPALLGGTLPVTAAR